MRQVFAGTLVVALALAGCAPSRPATPATVAPKVTLTPPLAGKKPGTVVVTLYFSTPDARGLISEKRDVTPTASKYAGDAVLEDPALAVDVIRELVAGPRTRSFYPTLPRTTKLLGWRMGPDPGVLTLDFSESLVKDNPGGETGYRLAIYSIVDSVAAIPGVAAVRFKIRNQPNKYVGGFIDISQPLTPDLKLVVR